MICSSCGGELLEGKRFCHECGAEVRLACPSCGAAVASSFRFCPDCGTRIQRDATAESPAPIPDRFDRVFRHIPVDLADKIRAGRASGGERKLVTVLFCDLVGSTAIAERLDPEEWHELLDQYLEPAIREIYRWEGIVNQLAGDGFMALFGAPLAHEDAPQRALRAALGIRHALSDFNDKLKARQRRDFELRVRVGIHTGPVVVGTVGNDLKMDYTAIGDTTNLASRLQSLAEPGTILVSEATQRMVRGFFRLRPAGPFNVKGKREPVPAYEVLGISNASTPMAVAAARGLTPLVGRDEELFHLEGCFSRITGNLAQLVSVVGEAGSGKSRLLYEFKQRVESKPVVFLEARCSSLTQGLPYLPIIEMLRQHFGLKPGDPPEIAREKVLRVLEGIGDGMAQAYPVLCHFLSISIDGVENLPAEELRRGTFEAVYGLVGGTSRRTPVVMIIEDLHWSDDSSREILELAVAKMRSAHVMVVVSHRPDFQPNWRVGASFTQINLSRLTQEQGTALIRGITGCPLPVELERRILRKAEGNPFFIEELTRGLFEEGFLVCTEDGARVTKPVEEIRIPDTVQELVAARLDRLGPRAKRVVQVAATLGRQFRCDPLAALLSGEGIDAAAELEELERSGVIHRKNLLARDEFRFGESLTQEVAYEGLLLKERRELHGRIGHLLESAPGETSVERIALIARHFARSDNHRKAVETLLLAGEAAETLPSYPAALASYRQAWELAEPMLGTPEGPREAGADAGQEGAHEKLCRQALQAGVGLNRLTFLYGSGDPSAADRAATRCRALAKELDDAASLATLCSLQGVNLMAGGPAQFDRGLALSEEGLVTAQQAGLTIPALSISRDLAFSYLLDGRFELSRRTIDWVFGELAQGGHAEKLSDLYVAVYWIRGVIRYFSDDLTEALRIAQEAYELAGRAPNRTVHGGAATLAASILFDRAEYAEAKRWGEISFEVAEAIGNVAPVRTGAAVAVAAAIELGEKVDPERHLQLIERGIVFTGNAPPNTRLFVQAFLAAGEVERAGRIARLAYERAGGRLRETNASIAMADVMTAMGEKQWEEAARWYERSIAQAEGLGARSALATARLGAGAVAKARGDRAEAIRQLASSIALCRELGLRRDERRGEKLLAGLG